MLTNAHSCSLCGLPLPANPIRREFDGQQKDFCCEGCALVYQMALANGMLEQVLQTTGMKERAPLNLKARIAPVRESAFFDIDGMWCAGCAVAAERVLRRQPGVREADISFAAGRGRIEYDPGRAQPAELLGLLHPLGYRAKVTSSKEEQQKERLQNRIGLQLMAAAAFGMEIMVLYLVQLYPLYALGQYDSLAARRIQYVVWAMATPVVFYGGLTFLAGTWRSLKARTVGMDSLVALGVLSAYFYSAYVTVTGQGQTYFDSASMITTFILLGRYLEATGGAQARRDLRTLLHLQPDKAWRKSGDGWEQVRAAELARGDIILVKPGEHIPADALILAGEAQADESMLTGESLPVAKAAQDTVFAGTLLRGGALTCKVVQPPGSTRLSQIADLVMHTLSQKPAIQRLADRASMYFAYAILLVAVATFAGWYLREHSIARSLLAAVAVLVVACPCALGLATPLALAVTMGRAARRGILVRTPSALETAISIHRMVFDKTGTLTRGALAVASIVPASSTGLPPKELLRLAGSVEQFSEHPIARAILSASHEPPYPAGQFIALAGAGASARLEERNQRVTVGSDRLVNPEAERELTAQASQRAAQGETVVWVALDSQVAGFLTLRDQPNPTARPALEKLVAMDIRAVMLSGDTPETAGTIAGELGLDSFEGGCTPEEKAARISQWQRSGERVGMTGDGVNDAPALAQADLSITAAGGTDIAGQASDLVLTRPDLTLIPCFIQLSQRTRRTILENLGWAFAYNLVAVPLAVLGLINPVIAAIAMAVSSLIVVSNSLRLRAE